MVIYSSVHMNCIYFSFDWCDWLFYLEKVPESYRVCISAMTCENIGGSFREVLIGDIPEDVREYLSDPLFEIEVRKLWISNGL